ncbi:MAG: hypothetical protein K8R36_15575 [Planctomycetales bacterium]|nr:hypothetical protein [Planctomycetales bacterium]
MSRRSLLHACAAFGGCWLLPRLAPAQGMTPTRHGREAQEEKADSSREAREEALRIIPWNKLNDESQRKLRSVVDTPSIYRRMPKKTVDCDSGLYLFLLRNPEVVVNMWQVMGVSNMTADRTGPFSWKGNDGAGTQCNVELAYGTNDLHIMYGEGFYEGSLFKRRMSGRCVLLLRSGYAQDGRSRVATLLDMFLTVDNAGLDLVAKTLSPLVGSTADANFAETAKFLGRVSLTAEKNGPKLEQMTAKLTKVEPQVREQFVQLTTEIYQANALGEASAVRPVNDLRR